nr:hypothetical protein [Tanacetum cinerariifolium]
MVNTEIASLKNGEGISTGRGSHTKNTHYGKMTKIEFLKIHGEDVKGWVYRSLIWHQQYVKKYEKGTPWEMYEVEELFEAVLNRVELNEAYDVSLFIGGLKKEVRMPIRMFKITTLSDVYAMAKMQKATNAVLKPRYNPPLLPTFKFVPNFINKPVNAPLKSAIVNGGNQIVARNGGNRPYRLTQKELEEKGAKNQCFYCDQKYFLGHKCSGQIYSLEVVSENHDELVTEGENETFEDCVEEVITMESNPQISLNALSVLNSFQTMRVKGMFEKHTLHILVDCGSTHNFLDLKTAKNLGCKLENTTPLQVSMANGCEMGLGIQWLATLGDIQCNFQNLTMKFKCNGRRMVLRETKNTIIHWMQGRNASKNGQINQVELASMVLCVYPARFWQMNGTTIVDKELNKYTVKDKFPIPVIEELIDELNGSAVFSKLDLRRFIKNYAGINQPLTTLLKNNSFKWNVAAELAYNQLKKAMMEAPVLALPNFDQEFVVETDASGIGIGAVLCQNGHQIAYFCKTLAPKHQSLSTYEKEFLAVMAALEIWKGYLLDSHFKIRTYHFSLKYLLNQKLTTPFQLKWLPKLLGDCDIFQRQKLDLSAYHGLIQPLPILERVWTEVTMDFIEKLPISGGKSVAQVFMDNVYKLHGLPESIVSDRDKVFMSGFWKDLFAELKVKLKFFTACHPQTDGQTELKKCHGNQHQMGVLPQMIKDGKLAHKPVAILERRLGKLNNKPVMYVLTQWVNKPIDEATWEVYGDLITRFPRV